MASSSHQEAKGHDLEDALHGEDDREGHVQVLEHGLVRRGCGVILEIEERHRGIKVQEKLQMRRMRKWNTPSTSQSGASLVMPVLYHGKVARRQCSSTG